MFSLEPMNSQEIPAASLAPAVKLWRHLRRKGVTHVTYWFLDRVLWRKVFPHAFRLVTFPVWVLGYELNPLVGTGWPPCQPERIAEDLEAMLGINVIRIRIDPKEFLAFQSAAEFSPEYKRYKARWFEEKCLEYFVSAKLLSLCERDVYVDIASAASPFPVIAERMYGCKAYRQDIAYPLGVSGRVIGSDACALPLPDGFASKITLHCSFEHFEKDADRAFVAEANRVLRPGGKMCIIPLYMADKHYNMTDPFVNRRGVVWDEGAATTNVRGWRNRFGRHYDVMAFKNRIWNCRGNLTVQIILVENATEIGPDCYLRFAALFLRD